jgi:hypothetical protein
MGVLFSLLVCAFPWLMLYFIYDWVATAYKLSRPHVLQRDRCQRPYHLSGGCISRSSVQNTEVNHGSILSEPHPI